MQSSLTYVFGSGRLWFRHEGRRREIRRDDVPIGVIDDPVLPKLRLTGQPPNQTCLDKDGMYALSFRWPDEERARWERVKATAAESEPLSQVSPYTEEEKEWLKENWGGEFRFLRAHLLKIHDEEDRAEGRRIVRAMKHDSGESYGDGGDGGDDDE